MTVLTSTDYVHVPATAPVLVTVVRVTKVLVSVISATEVLAEQRSASGHRQNDKNKLKVKH